MILNIVLLIILILIVINIFYMRLISIFVKLGWKQFIKIYIYFILVTIILNLSKMTIINNKVVDIKYFFL